MPGTFFGLEIGRRGLQNHQRALDIIGHNITNASTEGYTRQEAVFTQTDPYTVPELDSSATPGQFGTGLMTSMIRRIRDEYLDPQVRGANTDRYYWEDQIDIFKRLEANFAEPAASGINDQMAEFFKNWMNLNNNPQDPGVKAVVMQSGQQLATLMSYTYKQMDTLQESIMKESTTAPGTVDSGQLKDQVDRINTLLSQIQNYTTDIMKVYRVGQQPNDLMDKRDLALDELSKFGPLDVTYHTNNGIPTGEITMTFFGMTIATGDNRNFDLSINGANLELHETTGTGFVLDLTAQRNNTAIGGSLLGLERARQEIIGFMDTMNDMSVYLRDEINSFLIADDFFAGSLDNLVTGFIVNPAIVSDPTLIDGTVAGDIANIRQNVMDPATRPYTLEECFGMLTADVGSKAKGTDDMAASLQAIQEQMFNLRESVVGVSLDEELSKMVQFQYGYQGSARVVGMVDELLDYLINRMKNF